MNMLYLLEQSPEQFRDELRRSKDSLEQVVEYRDLPALMADLRFMDRALALGERGVGETNPNPAVGCVLVRGGVVVGEGFHARAGGPHAIFHAAMGGTPSRTRSSSSQARAVRHSSRPPARTRERGPPRRAGMGPTTVRHRCRTGRPGGSDGPRGRPCASREWWAARRPARTPR